MTSSSKPEGVALRDYKPSSYLIESAFLHFDLLNVVTHVTSVLKFYRNPAAERAFSLTLDGEALQLERIHLDGKPLGSDRYHLDETRLTLFDTPEVFTLECEVSIYPDKNTALSGLYQSRGNYCTQCEAQGFRRITYF